MLFLQVSPVILFLALIAGRILPAVPAATASLLLAIIIATGFAPTAITLAETLHIVLAGAWVALPAVLVILTGLYFTEVLEIAGEHPADAPATTISARQMGTVCLFLGPFVETATGFGVGYVVAIGVILKAGIGPAAALALAAFSQMLVPWGALGIGTQISAAIAGIPVEALGWRIALVVAPLLLIIAPLYWRIAQSAGITIDGPQKREDAASMLALAMLLIGTNAILPIELAGLLAIGPVLLFRLWRQERAHFLTRSSFQRSAPYLILIAVLAVTKLIPGIRDALATPAFTPGNGAPAFAPLASPANALVLAAILGCIAHGRWTALGAAIPSALTKGTRASILTILLVALAWVIVRSGIAQVVADALRDTMGERAALVVPILGSIGGYLTGSNTGAGSLAMPVANAVASAPALLWIAAAAIMAGSVFTAFSPVRFAMGQAIAEATPSESRTALRLLLPFALASVAIAILAVVIVL